MRSFVPLIALAFGAACAGKVGQEQPSNSWVPMVAPPEYGQSRSFSPALPTPSGVHAAPGSGHRSHLPPPPPSHSFNQAPYPQQKAYSPRHSTLAVAAPVVAPRVHEIHTHSARQHIRVEEYNRPTQVIRVHEAPQAPPQIVKLQAPTEPPSVIRVVTKNAGPAVVERVVHEAPAPQVINVHKPAPAPARIVQVVRGEAPAPRVEFHYEETPAHEVHVAHAPVAQSLLVAAPVPVLAPAHHAVKVAAPAFVATGPAHAPSHVFAPPTHAHHVQHNVHARVVQSRPVVSHAPNFVATVRAQAVPSYVPARQVALPSPAFGAAPSFNPQPLGPPPTFQHTPSANRSPRPLGTVYDAGDHLKIVKERRH